MKSHVSRGFVQRLRALPDHVRKQAYMAYDQFKRDMHASALDCKAVTSRQGKTLYSVRVGIHYRVLADLRSGELYWFWIGTHAEYDKLLA
jgi:mRNA-degrading endonuclease HigB of HigAB toxin-antitoxin module